MKKKKYILTSVSLGLLILVLTLMIRSGNENNSHIPVNRLPQSVVATSKAKLLNTDTASCATHCHVQLTETVTARKIKKVKINDILHSGPQVVGSWFKMSSDTSDAG